jgi:5-formyltetrahydrofolate cyclo-ligase
MEALVFDAESTVLVKNKQHIPEPLYGENIDPLLIDAVIIPLLAFDKLGHRVGYGAGFYDRFLERCKPDVLKIGVSLFEPIDKILDTHHQDIRLTHCITPKQIYFFD